MQPSNDNKNDYDDNNDNSDDNISPIRIPDISIVGHSLIMKLSSSGNNQKIIFLPKQVRFQPKKKQGLNIFCCLFFVAKPPPDLQVSQVSRTLTGSN